MFESAELGQKLSKEEFGQKETLLRTRLLELQYQLREAGIPLILLVSGVEGSDKSGVVKRLNKWLDPRNIRTYGFWDETDEETQRPFYWRFWRCLPKQGEIAIMFGSWYTRPIVDRVFDNIDDNQYMLSLQTINSHEKLLTDGGYIIIKLWYHIDQKTQQERLEHKVRLAHSPTAGLYKKYSKHYDDFVNVSTQALSNTDTLSSPWHIIEATDKHYRDATTGQVLLETLEQVLENHKNSTPPVAATITTPTEQSLLDNVDLRAVLDDETYEKKLSHYQKEVSRLMWRAKDEQRSVILLFEGWDAAGKGGTIRRAVASIDARLYRVIPVAAPSDEEREHHYLWRFWRHLPRDGYMTVYDRSWYGRVLVERVEGFAQDEEWRRAYHEITDFEQQLVNGGTILCKFWLHISPDEQLRRFEERQQVPWKQHKITDEDWRNREKWDAYSQAVHDMISRTSTQTAAWNIIAANDKKHARVETLKIIQETLTQALDNSKS